jgi:hypothetical protein
MPTFPTSLWRRLPRTATDPKQQHGADKPPLSLIPATALIPLSRALEQGAGKYGPYNWRRTPISASVYQNAALRHLLAWWDGEDVDVESGQSHLAHVMANCAILIDARMADTLQDDRP